MDRLLGAVLLACSAACGGVRPPAPLPADAAVILVRNPSSQPLLTTVCGPVECSQPRVLRAGSHARFVVRAGRGTRAVVTAKRADDVVALHPVDFSPGDEIVVEIGALPPHSAASPGG
jgi:hypothetical protein